VIVFAVFMLLRREDLRNRLLRLVGQRHLNITTQALDDAALRVSRYLLLQMVVNAAYALVFAIGLYFIGAPNALLWGVLAGVLPYVGTLMAAIGPVLLAVAVFPGWTRPLMTIAVFAGLELLVANILEPLLYGAHTGISPLALLVAAVFWTVLWGPLGLILSAPLALCIVALGSIPQLEFISIVLGDECVLPLKSQFYQRLLAADQEEALELSVKFLKENTLVELYDSVIIPALSREIDRHQGALDGSKEQFICQSTTELVEDLGERTIENAQPGDDAGDSVPQTASTSNRFFNVKIRCVPVRDEADSITATMLAQLLQQAGYRAQSLTVGPLVGEIMQDISKEQTDIVCVAALPPFALTQARVFCKRLRAQCPDLRIVVGLWTVGDAKLAQERFGLCANSVTTSLNQAIEHIRQLAELLVLDQESAAARQSIG
jgi:hypothetical protein